MQFLKLTLKRDFATLYRDYTVSTYAKFSEKQTFLTPSYAHARVRIKGLEMFF